MPTKLGQNFLNNGIIADKIIQSAKLSDNDFILEIGAGKGILTKKLAGKSGRVVSIEIDSDLIPILQTEFSDYSNVQIINDDILKINLPKLLHQNNVTPFGYKVIANIPYYITAKILRLFLETKIPPNEMILMVQKEFAIRVRVLAIKMINLRILLICGKVCINPIFLLNGIKITLQRIYRITMHIKILKQKSLLC